MTERKRAAAINADSGEQHDVRLDYAAAAPDAIEGARVKKWAVSSDQRIV